MKAIFTAAIVAASVLLSVVTATPVSSAPPKTLLQADMLQLGADDPVCGHVYNRFTTEYWGTIYGSKFDTKTNAEGMSLTCNKCVLMHGKKSVKVKIVGMCEGCGENAFEVSKTVLQALTGKASNPDGVDDIPWEFVDCEAKV
ncbi:hypothetical protein GGH91_002418 [Coemansia sp. RSA 2671]|uniref:RlpA-like double-psi beta-barrel-protein domain-containing protein-containing protein n=1 Tax=Coemansia spiralis TaxID=417178 RepID=A0A9W8GPQ7_9FUNG|nr:hypothetical protein LPJ60_003793 [Coemansia sp. RSA 2675]KAJ2345789.1 hypothetical protein GGH91_002418 [Coemansia sp. RSA 2671]KAJ2690744.1 hypothetical protein IWW39_000546 [Coemansia spiralis]